MSAPSACVSLTLVSRPQTLTLVRTMLSGFADALRLDPELLDDLKTAVSEACNDVVMHAYPPGIVGAVLGRLARAMAATAHFSLDRFSDVYLVCGALADSVPGLAAGGRLACSLDTEPKRLLVRVGPLRAGSGREITEHPAHRSQGSPLQRLSDEFRAEPADGAGEVMELVMVDRRR